MNKYILNPAHENDTIITRTSDGTEVVVTKAIFNDYFAEMMLKNNQHHLVKLNAMYVPEVSEKKTFDQISDSVILLTSNPDEIGMKKQDQPVNVPASNQKHGKRFPKKGSQETAGLNQPK